MIHLEAKNLLIKMDMELTQWQQQQEEQKV